jgi:hypothetical protein
LIPSSTRAGRTACPLRARSDGEPGWFTVAHGQAGHTADLRRRRSAPQDAKPSKLVLPSPRCTIVSAMSAESRPGRHAVASRAWTRRPRPEGWQLSRERGRSRARGGAHVERLENPQVTYPICARVCARDAAGPIETEEMPSFDTDAVPPVDRGQRDDRRRSERPETYVVWLITQRRTVRSVL